MPPTTAPVASPAATLEEASRDLGFGGRVTQLSRTRFLNRDGSFNVVRSGVPFLRSLSLYHALLTVSWPAFFGLVVATYFVTNLIFCAGYLLCGPGALRGAATHTLADRISEAFFFSVQTLATIGYGRVRPNGLPANMLITFEALVGLLGFAVATGLLFARISRPNARVVFSHRAVIAPYQGQTALMFRIANERSNELLEVEATVTLARLETLGGTTLRRFYPLRLERSRVVFLPLHWVIVHPIDESSPLHAETRETFEACDPEILVLVTATDETFSQTVHARSSYKQHEVAWGARFRDMFQPSADGRVSVDMRRIHDIESA